MKSIPQALLPFLLVVVVLLLGGGNTVQPVNAFLKHKNKKKASTTAATTMHKVYYETRQFDVTRYEDFRRYLERHQYVFLQYATSWSVWCQRLAPTWEKVARQVGEDATPAVIGVVDCTSNIQMQVCREENVTAFPTLRFYTYGTPTTPDYKLDRTSNAIVKYIKQQIELNSANAKDSDDLIDSMDGNGDTALDGDDSNGGATGESVESDEEQKASPDEQDDEEPSSDDDSSNMIIQQQPPRPESAMAKPIKQMGYYNNHDYYGTTTNMDTSASSSSSSSGNAIDTTSYMGKMCHKQNLVFKESGSGGSDRYSSRYNDGDSPEYENYKNRLRTEIAERCPSLTTNPRGTYNTYYAPCQFQFHSVSSTSNNFPRKTKNKIKSHMSLSDACTPNNIYNKDPFGSSQIEPIEDYVRNWKDECVGDGHRCYSLDKDNEAKIVLQHFCKNGWEIPTDGLGLDGPQKVTHVSVSCKNDKFIAKQKFDDQNEKESHYMKTNKNHMDQQDKHHKEKVNLIVGIVVLLLGCCWICVGFCYTFVIHPYLKAMKRSKSDPDMQPLVAANKDTDKDTV